MNTRYEQWRARLARACAASAVAVLAACGGGGGDGGSAPGSPGGGGGGGGNEPPPAQVQFVAVGSSAHTASLSWTPVAGATGYTIERRSAGGAFTPVATLAADADTFVDEALLPNTAYTYRVVPAGVQATVAEQVATTSSDVPVVTAAGIAQGTATEGTVGAAGATIALPDGSVEVVVPPSALPTGSSVSLQPITNTAPSGQGDGVRVRVAAAPSQPLTLTLRYEPELDGNADGLGIALRRADGSWLSLPIIAADSNARTLTAKLPASLVTQPDGRPVQPQSGVVRPAANVSLEFDVIKYLNFHLAPREATIRTGATQLLVPRARTSVVIGHTCMNDPDYGCIPLPLLDTREIPFENEKDGYTRRWFVFAEEGGAPGLGTITPRAGTGAVYKAPAQVPTPNPVLVTFTSKHDRSGRTLTLTSSIRVEEPVWTGIAAGTLSAPGGDLAFHMTIEAVWTPVEGSNGTLYHANGTQNVTVIDISCDGETSPSSAPLPPGALTIDRSVEPWRYTLDVGSFWPTVTFAACPNGSASVGWEVPSHIVVEGTVSGDGTKIEGQAVVNGVLWEWALTSEL